MFVNGRVEWKCGCAHRVYRGKREELPEIGTDVTCENHGETTVARTTYVSV